jgi:hypothetical protein
MTTMATMMVTTMPKVEKLAMEIFELEEFHPGSQKHTDWLPEPYEL